MVVCLDVIVQLLPEITKHFRTLQPLSLLRQTCKTLADETRENLQVYRSVLANMYLMNKYEGCRLFVLSTYDVRSLDFVLASRFSWWDRQRYKLRNGHLLSPRVLFDKAIVKHKSISGVSKAFTKRKLRAMVWFLHKHMQRVIMGMVVAEV